MGAIQQSINQLTNTAGALAALGKHIKEQSEANELAKGRELVDLRNIEAETEDSIANMQEGQQVLQERNPEIGTPAGNAMLAEGDENLERAVKAMNILDKKIVAKQVQLG